MGQNGPQQVKERALHSARTTKSARGDKKQILQLFLGNASIINLNHLHMKDIYLDIYSIDSTVQFCYLNCVDFVRMKKQMGFD